MQSEPGVVLHVKDEGRPSELEWSGYRVRDATDAESALAVLDAEAVDAVVCDATPDDDRLDVLEAIAPVTATTPVLARTPEPDGDLASAATARGAVAYCTHDDDLVARVDGILPRVARTDDSEWYRRLYEAGTAGEADVEETARRLLAVGCERLDLPYGYLTRFEGDEQHVVAAVGDHEALQPASRISFSESYCKYTAESDDGYLDLADAEHDAPDRSVYEATGIGCYVGGMVEPDGETYGSLCFADDAARAREFDDVDRTFVEFTAELFEHELVRRTHRRDLEATRERYERAVERIDDGFFALDDDWRFTYVNAYAGGLLDRDPRALVGEHIWDQFPDDTAGTLRERYEAAMADQEPVVFEEYFDDIGSWFEVSAYPSPDGLSVHFKDVTRRKERETKVRSLLSAVQDLYGERDREVVAERVVDATQHILGHDYVVVRLHDDETNALPVAASTDHVDAHMPDRPTYEPGDDGAGTAFEDGEVLERTVDYERFSKARYYPLGDHGVISVGIQTDDDATSTADQRFVEILAANATAALDLADRQRALERYESVLENVQDMVFVLDDGGAFEYVTQPFATTLDVDRDALTGRDANDVFAASADAIADVTNELLAGDRTGASLRTELDAADGSVPVDVEFSVLSGNDSAGIDSGGNDSADAGGDAVDHRGVVGVVHDVSDLAETRARLQTENERFQHLFETLPDPVAESRFVDGEPIVERVNPAFERVFGYDGDDVVGHSINDFIVADDRVDEARDLDNTTERGATGDEPVVSREVVRETATGERNFLFRGISYPEGGVHRGYGIYTDITSQRERERRLEVLHTVLRHNLRTEMTLIAGYVDELAKAVEDTDVAERVHEAVDEVVALGDKARNLERILGEPTDVRDVALHERVQDAVADATADAPNAPVSVDATPVTVAADHRIEAAIRNLVENAIEHGDGDVAVTVETTADSATVRVSDDGDGVPEFERELLAGERDITQLEHGSGLGLWIANWLLDAFDGDLRFETEGERSAVVAELPRSTDETEGGDGDETEGGDDRDETEGGDDRDETEADEEGR